MTRDLRERARTIVEETNTSLGRAFDLMVQSLVFVSLLTFSLETIPGLEPRTYRLLAAVEAVTVVLFTVEYALRVWVASPRIKFIFSFFGLVDLLAILPFYLAVGFDMRSLRAVRLLRLFRTLKLIRYSRAIKRFHRAFSIAREELVLFFCASGILLYLAGVGVYVCEREAQPQQFASVFDGLWWAVVTLTTVGYGDFVPVTPGGRVFTFVVLLLGLGVVAVPSGLVATSLAQARREEEDERVAETG